MDKKYTPLLHNVFNIALVAGVFFILRSFESDRPTFENISPYLSLGFLIIVAYLAGRIAMILSLPSLTGYLIAGLAFGPGIAGLITHTDIAALELINALALSFIAITAGGELRIKSLKKNIRPILSITCSHTLIIFLGTAGAFVLLCNIPSVMPVSDPQALNAFPLLLAVIALANSPASTIAIIAEYKAKGDFPDVILSITMLKDTIVLVFFSIVLAYISGMTGDDLLSLPLLFETLGHLFISGAAGVLYGFLMIIFFKFVAREMTIFIVIASYCAHVFANVAGVEHLLMCLVAGFTVQNFSKQGAMMIEAIEGSHLPIYVVFFSIAGAGLDFSFLSRSFVIVAVFLIVRTVLLYISTHIGAVAVRADDAIRKYSWTGFVTNAGLSISILIVIENSFPAWGGLFKSVVISAIAVNQIAGPVLFKYGLAQGTGSAGVRPTAGERQSSG